MSWFRSKGLCLGLIFLIVTPASASSEYLGQALPEGKAVVFAPGVVSTGDLHGRLTIAPDGSALFWTAFSQTNEGLTARILHVERKGETWSAPKPLPAGGSDSANTLFSRDGRRLYFKVSMGQPKVWVTRYVERTPQGWSEPKTDVKPFNTSLSFTTSGRAYYSGELPGKPWDRGIFVADYEGGSLSNVRALPPHINSQFIDYTPYIAPDESYLMFSSSRPSAKEDMHLYISFRKADGAWAEPQPMGKALGFDGSARFPSLSTDGTLLFFCGDDGNI